MLNDKKKNLFTLYKKRRLKSSKYNNENFCNDENSINQYFNILYPNFNMTKGPNDFWDILDDNTKDSSSIIDKLHRTIDYRIKYELNIENDMNSFFNKSTNNNLNNSVYDRLYNQGFFMKNKLIIKRLRSMDNTLKTSKTTKISKNSLKYLKIKKSKSTKSTKRSKKTKIYVNNEFTFQPKINSNLLKLMQNIPKKNKTAYSSDFYKNSEFNILYENLNRYKSTFDIINLKKNNYNKISNRILYLYEEGLNHIKKAQQDYLENQKKIEREMYKTNKDNTNKILSKSFAWDKNSEEYKSKIAKIIERNTNFQKTKNKSEDKLFDKKTFNKSRNKKIIIHKHSKANSYVALQKLYSKYHNSDRNNNNSNSKNNSNNFNYKERINERLNKKNRIKNKNNNSPTNKNKGYNKKLLDCNLLDSSNKKKYMKNQDETNFLELIKESKYKINKKKEKSKSKIKHENIKKKINLSFYFKKNLNLKRKLPNKQIIIHKFEIQQLKNSRSKSKLNSRKSNKSEINRCKTNKTFLKSIKTNSFVDFNTSRKNSFIIHKNTMQTKFEKQRKKNKIFENSNIKDNYKDGKKGTSKKYNRDRKAKRNTLFEVEIKKNSLFENSKNLKINKLQSNSVRNSLAGNKILIDTKIKKKILEDSKSEKSSFLENESISDSISDDKKC